MLSLLKQVASWPKTKNIPVCVGADVGGSGVRIRVSSALDATKFVDIPHIKTQSSGTLAKAFEEVSANLKQVAPNHEVAGAAVALAGPVKNNNFVVLTNWAGTNEDRTVDLAKMPPAILPPGKSTFLNDLESGTYGAISAEKSGIINDYFEQLFTSVAPKGPVISNGRTAMFAMGSGLGVGLILKTKLLQEPLVVASELGHVGIPMVGECHEDFAKEKPLLDFASYKWNKGRHAPEFEDVSSGRGIQAIYEYLTKGDILTGAQIAEKAKNGDQLAKEAVILQHLYLFREAKLLAVTLGCDSCLLTLDNAVANNYILHEAEERFQKEFYDFIRPEWMENVRMYTQTKKLNLNILGADYVAHTLAAKK